MYMIVHAVNQQIGDDIDFGDLLVLTKFAEMMGDSLPLRFRVSRARLQAATRMDRRTLKRHTDRLAKLGYLVPLENGSDKRTGERPILYELRLPEGYNKKVILQRLKAGYYGGKPFDPYEYKDKRKTAKYLSPVSYEEANLTDKMSAPTDKMSASTDKMSVATDKMSARADKIHPLNNIRIEEQQQLKEGGGVVVVDDIVKKTLEMAARVSETTSEDFANLGVTAENAADVSRTIEEFRELREKHPEQIKSSPPGVLRKMMEKCVKRGPDAATPRILLSERAAEMKRQARSDELEKVWGPMLLDRVKLWQAADDRLIEPHRRFISRFSGDVEAAKQFCERFCALDEVVAAVKLDTNNEDAVDCDAILAALERELG